MASWSEPDRAFLRSISDRRDWIGEAMARFSDRSEASVRCMMQKVRADMGCSDTRLVESAWMADAVNGSAMLLERQGLVVRRPSCTVWCGQCEQRVDDLRAERCGSPWCKAKDIAA